MPLTSTYRDIRFLRSTSTGDLHEARHAVLGRPVQIRTIRSELSESERANIRDAVIAASSLVHPNILSPIDAEFGTGDDYYVVDAMDACLRDLLEDKLPLASALQASLQIAVALAFAHQNGLLHGGITPSRIWRDTAGQYRLADFGLASAHADSATGRIALDADSADYLPARVLRKPETYDESADRYACGAVIAQVLTGFVPEDGVVEVAPGAEPLAPSLRAAIEALLTGRATASDLAEAAACIERHMRPSAQPDQGDSEPTANVNRPSAPAEPPKPAPVAFERKASLALSTHSAAQAKKATDAGPSEHSAPTPPPPPKRAIEVDPTDKLVAGRVAEN